MLIAQSVILILKLKILARTIDQESDTTESWVEVANVHENSGNYDKAISAYKQALKIKPDEINVWKMLGKLCFDLEEYENAVICCIGMTKLAETNAYDIAVLATGNGALYLAANRVKQLNKEVLNHHWQDR